MILRSIRLHPFGGTIARTYDLARPVAVVLGPNEAGKTTMRQAIHHALFTPTKQTEKQALAVVGRWYPQPAGDHAAVTLVFEHDGVEWTLTKRWGAGNGSALAATGAAAVGDAATVQARLAEFLGHNEATGRLVLYTGQTELARTVALLQEARKKNEIQPVADVLANAAGVAGGVGPERLRAVLVKKIAGSFGRWNRAHGGPEPDQGQERGIGYPWQNGVGLILKGWYAWQRKAAELIELNAAERQLDAVSASLAALETQMAADRDFLAKGGPLRDGLGLRSTLEADLRGFRAAKAGLAEIMARWPVADTGVAAAKKQLDDLQKQKQDLVTEQVNAGRRAEADQKKTEFAALTAARQEWLDANDAVKNSFQPAAKVVAELEQVAERIKDARNRIEAQKLAYEIAAKTPLTIRIEEADEPPRDVPVDGGLSGVAKSRLRIDAGPVTVTVTSGEEDIAALFAGLESDAARERALLADCRAEALVDVKAQGKRHDGLVAAAALRQAAWESRLRGRTFDQCQEEIDALAGLPQTRDAAIIAGKITEVEHLIGIGNGTLRLHEENVRLWTEKYETQEKLLDALVELQSKIQKNEDRIRSLPAAPAGFATTEDFLRELARREAENLARPEKLKDLATQQQQLRDQIGDRTATDIAEESEHLEQSFQRKLSEGRAYERILAVLEEVVSEQEADPLAGFTAKVTDSFRRITGGTDDLEFDDHLPIEVTRGTVALPPDLLSQGAGSALALALRLALAEAHLGEATGFIVLDDPFVDLDADRRERAKELLRQFAAKHQVLFLTCHELHAAGLGRTSG